MTTFDDREKGFEMKFALDQELMFRAHARRDKLFGLWIAGKLGLTGAAATDYAKAIVAEDIKEPGDRDVLAKVTADLAAKNIKFGDAELTAKLEQSFAEAKTQIAAEAKL